MITLNASGGSVTFTFSGNSTYLNDGTIEVPVNSLALIIDESDMVTFKKSQSSDIFVSANIAEFGMTKAELESWYKENAVGSTGGGGGITSGEVQTMIDESISGKADTATVEQELATKLDSSAYTPTVVDAALNSDSTNPVQNQTLYGELRVGGGTSKVEIDFNTGGYVPEGVTQLEVNPTTTDSWATYNFYNGNTKLGYYSFTNYSGSLRVGNSLEGSSYAISGETVIITYPASLGVTRIALDGGNTPWSFKAIVETPAVPLKDALSGKTNQSDFTAYTASTDAALSGKQDTLIAGRGISITTGETADTVSFNLPISAGTGTNSIAEGDYTTARGNYSHAEGQYAKANDNSSHAEGYGSSADGIYSHAEGFLTVAKGHSAHAEGNGTRTNNQAEHASGLYNVSNSVSTTWGDSGNTLFSVGNGRADNARHNAFEIRQNGDIYFFDGTNDVKLQDVISNILNRLTTIENNS